MRTGASILIVDNQPVLLDALSLALDAAGHQVFPVCSASEALALLQTQPIDMVLTEILLPHMDGYQLCRAVRAQQQFANLPFLFVSTMVLDSCLHDRQTLMSDGYLAKPVQPEELLAAVSKLLAAKKPVRSNTSPAPSSVVPPAIADTSTAVPVVSARAGREQNDTPTGLLIFS